MIFMGVYIRGLYSPGHSCIMAFFYRSNLSLRFARWIDKDERGIDRYDKKFITTTISDEAVATLLLLSMQIISGTLQNPAQYIFECFKATVLFEYRPDQNGQMRAYISMEKDKEKILFEFRVAQWKTKENGKTVEKTIQSGLLVFAEVLHAYLSAIGAYRQLDQIHEKVFGAPPPAPPVIW